MSIPRVFVTGIGLVSSLALETADHLQRLAQGASGVQEITEPDYSHFPCRLQARVETFDRRKKISNRMMRKLLTPSAAFALVAAGQALRDGNLEGNSEVLQDCGLYVGSLSLDIKPEMFTGALGESLNEDGQFDIATFAIRGTKFLDPLFLVKLLPNGGLCGTAIEYQVNGPNCNISNGTISGLQAVITAVSAVRRGEVDIALAGGYDSLLQMDSIIEHMTSDRLSKRNDQPDKACRPFASDRDGYVLAEGSAFLLLESESHAVKRSARIYGEIMGTGHNTNSDAFLQNNPGDSRGLVQAVRLALENGNSKSPRVDVIYGDGLADEENDLMEAAAYRELFSDNKTAPFFTAATGSMGFIGAASGVFSLAHGIAGLHQGIMFPMINCDRPDPRCPLPFVHSTHHRQHTHVLAWNSDGGFKNAAVLAGKV